MNKIMRQSLFVLFAFMLVVFLLPIRQAQAIEAKVYKVQAFNNFPVIFKDTDEVIKGMYVDLLSEISKKENSPNSGRGIR